MAAHAKGSLSGGVGLEQGLQVSSTFDQKERLGTCYISKILGKFQS